MAADDPVTHSRAPSLLDVQAKIDARKRDLSEARAEIARLKGALPAGKPSAPALVAAPAKATIPSVVPAPAQSVDQLALFAKYFATEDPVAKYDLACAISATHAGKPAPPSIATAAGREQRMAALHAELETEKCPQQRYRIAAQCNSLRFGETPSADFALSKAAAEEHHAHLDAKYAEATSSAEKSRIIDQARELRWH